MSRPPLVALQKYKHNPNNQTFIKKNFPAAKYLGITFYHPYISNQIYIVYEYAINYETNNPVFLIDDQIGIDEETGTGIAGKRFAREVFELDNRKPREITFYWNSQGGNVGDAFDMLNAINVCTSPTRSLIYGWAYSSAGWAAMAADKVSIVDYGTWMCHMPYDPNNPDRQSKFLTMVADSVAIIIANKSGRNGKAKKTPDEIKAMMLSTTYYNAQELFDAGLVDEIISSADYSVVKNEAEIVDYEHCRLVFNKIIKNKYQNPIPAMAFEKVTNRLNLASGSSEDAVINKIADMENDINSLRRKLEVAENKATAANDSKEDMARKLKEAMNTMNEATSNYDRLKEAYDAMTTDCNNLKATNKELTASNAAMREEKEKAENEAKQAAQNALNEKVNTLIAKYKTAGKITEKNESVYREMAVENFARTEVLLEGLASNFSAPRTMVDPNAPDGKLPAAPPSIKEIVALNKSKQAAK